MPESGDSPYLLNAALEILCAVNGFTGQQMEKLYSAGFSMAEGRWRRHPDRDVFVRDEVCYGKNENPWQEGNTVA